MNIADKVAHPWPLKGWFDFRFRRGIAVTATPWYGANNKHFDVLDITRLIIRRGWYPFYSYNIKYKGYGIHGYGGWKPIPVGRDPAFPWDKLTAVQDAIMAGELFVQLSFRGGVGSIS